MSLYQITPYQSISMIRLLAVPQLMNLCRFLSRSVLWCNSSQLDSVEKDSLVTSSIAGCDVNQLTQ